MSNKFNIAGHTLPLKKYVQRCLSIGENSAVIKLLQTSDNFELVLVLMGIKEYGFVPQEIVEPLFQLVFQHENKAVKNHASCVFLEGNSPKLFKRTRSAGCI